MLIRDCAPFWGGAHGGEGWLLSDWQSCTEELLLFLPLPITATGGADFFYFLFCFAFCSKAEVKPSLVICMMCVNSLRQYSNSHLKFEYPLIKYESLR